MGKLVVDMTHEERFALFVREASTSCPHGGGCSICVRMFGELEKLVLPKAAGEGRGDADG